MKAGGLFKDDMNYKTSIILSVIFFMVFIGSAIAAPLPPAATTSTVAVEKIETWADTHPRAASELGTWVNTYQEAAHQLFKWDFRHPEQTKLFVTWVNTHQGKCIDVFTAQHTDWNRLNRIITSHSTAMSGFVVWCRFHPKATAALMQHQRALYWVGQHLYAST